MQIQLINNIVSYLCFRMKDSKKNDQYRLLLTELELLIRSYASNTHHKNVLETVKNFRNAYISATKNEMDVAGTSSKSVVRATTDSPLSPPHPMDSLITNGNGLSLNNRYFLFRYLYELLT